MNEEDFIISEILNMNEILLSNLREFTIIVEEKEEVDQKTETSCSSLDFV